MGALSPSHQSRSKDYPMSKPTASAAGGAMPAEGHNIADAFDETRRLIIAASNLAAALDDTQAQGLHAAICAAEDKFMVAHNWFEAVATSKERLPR
jgi:hypothetical protein